MTFLLRLVKFNFFFFLKRNTLELTVPWDSFELYFCRRGHTFTALTCVLLSLLRGGSQANPGAEQVSTEALADPAGRTGWSRASLSAAEERQRRGLGGDCLTEPAVAPYLLPPPPPPPPPPRGASASIRRLQHSLLVSNISVRKLHYTHSQIVDTVKTRERHDEDDSVDENEGGVKESLLPS